jgi:hypothetical protein
MRTKPRFPRALIVGVAALGTAAATMTVSAPAMAVTGAVASTAAAPLPFAGTLMTTASDARPDRGGGLTTAMLQVGWNDAQPVAGRGLDPGYLAQLRATYDADRAAGLQVTLDPGLQYAPAWVFTLDRHSTRFVDQYGNVWHGDLGEDVPDAVHDPAVRTAEASYLALLAGAFGRTAFADVRAGGLLDGEMHLPPARYDGHINDWWSFGYAAARSAAVPGYRPGISVNNAAKDTVFLTGYLGAMANYQDFIVESLARDFAADVEVLYPSFGVRPGDAGAAVHVGLDGDSVRSGELAMGMDAGVLVPRLPAERAAARTAHRLIAYSTWLDGPSFGTSGQAESPIAYLASYAEPRGIPLAGENTADSARSPAALTLCADLVRRYHLLGLMWFDDQAVNTAGTPVTARALAGAVGR